MAGNAVAKPCPELVNLTLISLIFRFTQAGYQLVACLSKAENQADEGQINQLRARLRDRIAGQYGLGSVSIVYPGASLGGFAVAVIGALVVLFIYRKIKS